MDCRTKVTPPALAKRWGVDSHKVVQWIKTGELPAIDASSRQGRRPRFLIDEADIKAFEQRRAVVPPDTPTRQRRRRAGDVIEFFDRNGSPRRRF
jgi:hypothetical protein